MNHCYFLSNAYTLCNVNWGFLQTSTSIHLKTKRGRNRLTYFNSGHRMPLGLPTLFRVKLFCLPVEQGRRIIKMQVFLFQIYVGILFVKL
jgi:hypothetical protein